MKKTTLAMMLVLLVAVGWMQFQSRSSVGKLRQSVSLTFKPPQSMLSDDTVRIAAGEFNGIMADYMLLEVGSFLGSGVEASKEDYQNVYRALKQSLALDPYFQQTYLIIQGMLPWKAHMVDQAIELIDISRKHRPWDWRPGHYMGFDYYYFKNNFAKASEVLLDAAKIKGAPVLLAVLGARFAVRGQRTGAAILMLRRMLKDEKLPEPDRLDLEQRLAALNGVFSLEQAIEKYKSQTSNYPANLEALVQKGIIGAVPKNPYGVNYYYDPKTGLVTFDDIKTITDSN
jgi:tetratricopeptide (TPR) repeat protein